MKCILMKTSKLLTILLFLSWESVRMIFQLNTSEFQFLYPIIATYLFLNIMKIRKLKVLFY